MRGLRITILLIFVIFTLAGTLTAQQETKDSVLAKIVMKLISFDKNISRFGDTITIGATDDEMLKALRQMSETKILGKQFTTFKLLQPEETTKCNAVFLGNGLKAQHSEIVKLAKEHKVLTFVADKDALKKGFAVALEIEDNMPVIWMNLQNASECGSKISLDSLKLVIVKGKMRE